MSNVLQGYHKPAAFVATQGINFVLSFAMLMNCVTDKPNWITLAGDCGSNSLYWKYSTHPSRWLWLQQPILEILYGQKWSSRVQQYLCWKWTNLDEIWNSVSQMWGLALTDFGRDSRSRNSLRGIVFPPKKIKNCSHNFQVLWLQAVIT